MSGHRSDRFWRAAIGVGLVAILAAAFGGVVPNRAQASPTPAYKIRDLGTLGGAEADAADLNNNAEVVGGSSTGSNPNDVAFWWQHGVMHGPITHGASSTALGINDIGHMVGVTGPADGSSASGFVYNSNTKKLHTLRGLGGTCTIANDINNNEVAVGGSTLSGDCYTGPTAHAVEWIHRRPTDIGSLIGSMGNSFAYAINLRGQITGWSDAMGGIQDAFVWHAGRFYDLGGLPGAIFTFGADINPTGDVAGESDFSDGTYHAFLHTHGARHMVDLGTLGGAKSSAVGIGRTDVVVGTSTIADGDEHAFIYKNGAMSDLNDMIPPGTGWVLQVASNINDHGQIAGYGSIDGAPHSFLLTPSS